MENNLPIRKPLRLFKYNYSSPGAYFVTFCTHNRQQILSTVGAIHESPDEERAKNTVGAIHESPVQRHKKPKVLLTSFGHYVEALITDLPEHLNVSVPHYIIMPDHVHVIFEIVENEKLRAMRFEAAEYRSIISKAVGYIKMNSSKSIKNKTPETKIWQRGFYDHIIRNETDYREVVDYIYNNPLKWLYEHNIY